MKKYTNLSQLITEQTNDATFKIEGRPEDNLLNGAVLKRFAYSYTYPKDSVEIVTPTSILDYISASTEGDANQIKRVIDSLSNPAAVGISADPSNKAGLFGGKNRVEGHVYLFKNVPESSVTSVNPDQLIGKTGKNNITSFQVLSTPRTGGESIQQNLAKIMNAVGKSSGSANANKAGSKSTTNSGNLTMMELNVIMAQKGPGGREVGSAIYFKDIINGIFKNSSSSQALLKDPVKTESTAMKFTKGVASIFIPESDAKKIEPGFTVKGPGISPLTTITKKGEPLKGLVEFSLSNQTYSNQDPGPTLNFYNNYIFLESESPIMLVISKLFSMQRPLNSIVKNQTNTYTPEIKEAFTQILNMSGDADYKVDSSYNLDELTKTQLISIMTVWLVYAVNNGVIPRSEVETDTYPTIQQYIDIIKTGASGIAAINPQASQVNASTMSQATDAATKQKHTLRLAGRPTIENVEELFEVLYGAGWVASGTPGLVVGTPSTPTALTETQLISAAGDSYRGTSSWKQLNKSNFDVILEFDTSEIGAFNSDGTAKLYTPDYTGIHSALGLLRSFLIYAQKKVPQPGQPTINPVPTQAELTTAGNRMDANNKKIGPTDAEVAAVKAGFGWGADLEQAVQFYRRKYYNL